jgi:hypothetical protein
MLPIGPNINLRRMLPANSPLTNVDGRPRFGIFRLKRLPLRDQTTRRCAKLHHPAGTDPVLMVADGRSRTSPRESASIRHASLSQQIRERRPPVERGSHFPLESLRPAMRKLSETATSYSRGWTLTYRDLGGVGGNRS